MDPIREAQPMSPMTTWLRGGRSRRCDLRSMGAPQMNGNAVSLWLFEYGRTIVCVAAPTVEQAMADALNALMAEQGEEDAIQKDRG